MIRIIFILSVTIIFGFSENEKWEPVLVPEKKEGLINSAREIEVFQHGIKKEWGYNKPQTDTFIVIHPDSPKKNAPFSSALAYSELFNLRMYTLFKTRLILKTPSVYCITFLHDLEALFNL